MSNKIVWYILMKIYNGVVNRYSMSNLTKYDADLIARYFISKANQDKKSITNKKLQKLLYYAQAWNIVFNKEKLFEEDIEAWVHGPAVRDVYVKYKKYGFGEIRERVGLEEVKKISGKEKDLLNEVWKVYGKYDADYLEELTHSEEPWQEAREGLAGGEMSNNVISVSSMGKFYRKKLRQSKK